MPSNKVLEEKKALVASLVEKIKNSPSGVLVDYKGISVADDTKLRHDLREAGVEYMVVKNTMLRFAAEELGFTALNDLLNGTTALAIAGEDVVAPARILNDYARVSFFIIQLFTLFFNTFDQNLRKTYCSNLSNRIRYRKYGYTPSNLAAILSFIDHFSYIDQSVFIYTKDCTGYNTDKSNHCISHRRLR